MPLYHYTSLKGVRFKISRPFFLRGAESMFVIAPPKSGSVLLNELIKELCKHGRLPCFEFEPQLFQQGIYPLEVPLEAMLLLEKPGTVNLGFRTPYLLQYVRRYRTAKKIFLVRDPRDMAVSYYYSISRSHPQPTAKVGRDAFDAIRRQAADDSIDEFISAGKADHVISAMRGMISHINQFPNSHLFKYEEVIFRKREWILSLAELLGVDVPDQLMERLLARFDVIPEKEQPDQHIRQVAPGNHKTQLTPETIALIEEKHRDVMSYFNYL